jgi:hypothetical protein
MFRARERLRSDECNTHAVGIRNANSCEYPSDMSLSELRALLDQVADTRELVLRRSELHDDSWNAAYLAWSDAHVEAEEAYGAWQRGGGQTAYLLYRAAQDREDAAQDALAAFTPVG